MEQDYEAQGEQWTVTVGEDAQKSGHGLGLAWGMIKIQGKLRHLDERNLALKGPATKSLAIDKEFQIRILV